MNNTFNINRFGLLLKRQWLDFGKIYLMSLVVLIAIIVGFYLFNIPKLENLNLRWGNNGQATLGFRPIIFLLVGFLFISIESNTYFNVLGQKPKAIMELMTPASITEKFLGGVLFTMLNIASYLLIFYVIDQIFVSYLNNLWIHQKAMDYHTNKLASVHFSTIIDDMTSEKEFKFFFAMPFLVTSVFLLGSVYFNRFHYIKTALSITAFLSLVIFLTVKIAMWLTEGKEPKYDSGNQEKDFIFIIFFGITILLSLIIWVITYIRLKEKEV